MTGAGSAWLSGAETRCVRTVDLHLHTSYSDGSDTPTRVVQRAAECGLAAIAITDHDTVAGVEEARASAQGFPLEFVTGVEISSEEEGGEVHVTGLGVNPAAPGLIEALDTLTQARRERVETILSLLRKKGIDLGPSIADGGIDGGSIGRMHIAAALYARGFTRTVQEGFDRFLNPGRAAYVPKRNLNLDEAIARVHGAGGLAFLAHPGLGRHTRRRLQALLSYPFDGIEVYHAVHSAGETEGFLELARARNLLVAGGSDCHGTVKGNQPEMGKVRVPYEHFARLLEALAGRGATS